MDYETEFCSHLASLSGLRYFVGEGISEELLFSPTTKSIYIFAQHYLEESQNAPSIEVLREQFPRFVFGEVSSEPHWIAAKLRERYKRSRVQDVIRDAAKMVAEPDEAFRFLRETIFGIENTISSSRNVYTGEDFERKLEEYKEAVRNHRFIGATIGFEEVDQFTGGLRPGSLNFVLARPARYKTFFLLHAFVRQVLQGRKPVFYTLELTEDEIWRRLVCLVSGFSYYKMERGDFTQEEEAILRRAYERFHQTSPHFVIQPDIEERTVARIAMEADRLGADSIIIDQLSFLNSRNSYSGAHHLQISEIVRDMKNVATRKGREIPVLMAAQLNRSAAQQDKMADIAQAALSDAIGQTADACFALHQTKDMRDMNQLEFGIIKGRNHGMSSWMIDLDLYRETKFSVLYETGDE